jgi:hypothetical protein
MYIINYFKSFKKNPRMLSILLVVFSVAGVFLSAIISDRDGEIRDKIDKGVKAIEDGVVKIDTIVNDSKSKLETANEALITNNNLVIDNLVRTQTANEQLIKASEQLQKNYEQIVEGLKKSIEAKEETINAKEEIIGQTTGGDSYPSLSLKKGGFYLSTLGTYSIPNLRVSIRLIPNCLSIPRKVTLKYLRNQPTDPKYVIPIYYEKYNRLWAGFKFEYIDIKNLKSYIPNDDSIMHAFEIYFESDYKKWIQRIRIISHNGKWEIADVLYEIPTTQRDNIFIREEPIYKHVSENFPAIVIDGATKIIYFFNADLEHPTNPTVEFIEYKNGNEISGCSFDEL